MIGGAIGALGCGFAFGFVPDEGELSGFIRFDQSAIDRLGHEGAAERNREIGFVRPFAGLVPGRAEVGTLSGNLEVGRLAIGFHGLKSDLGDDRADGGDGASEVAVFRLGEVTDNHNVFRSDLRTPPSGPR